MIEITVRFQGEEIRIKDIELVGGLNAGIYCRVVLAQNLVGVQVGDLFHLAIESQEGETVEMQLAVSRFRLPIIGAGGWIALVDPIVSTQPPFDLEIFASRQGVMPVDVIGSRVQKIESPSVFRESKYPVVVVSDIAVSQMIDDFCARLGMYWWTDSEKLIISHEPGTIVELNGQQIEATETGTWIRSEAWIPLACQVRAAESELGIAIAYRLSGNPTVLEVHVGELPIATRALPKRVWSMPGTISSTDPFEVTLASGRSESPEVGASASLMIRRSSDFCERLPLSPETSLRVELYRGGISTELPIAYVWSVGDSADAYELTANEFRSEYEVLTTKVKRDASITAENIARITGKQIHLNEYQ